MSNSLNRPRQWRLEGARGRDHCVQLLYKFLISARHMTLTLEPDG